MQNAELQAMTVVQLRKLARENGVKLSARIDKSGIVPRLADALGEETEPVKAEDEAASQTEASEPEQKAPVQAEIEKLQDAPLSADVTAVAPGSCNSRACRCIPAHLTIIEGRSDLPGGPQ